MSYANMKPAPYAFVFLTKEPDLLPLVTKFVTERALKPILNPHFLNPRIQSVINTSMEDQAEFLTKTLTKSPVFGMDPAEVLASEEHRRSVFIAMLNFVQRRSNGEWAYKGEGTSREKGESPNVVVHSPSFNNQELLKALGQKLPPDYARYGINLCIDGDNGVENAGDLVKVGKLDAVFDLNLTMLRGPAPRPLAIQWRFGPPVSFEDLVALQVENAKK